MRWFAEKAAAVVLGLALGLVAAPWSAWAAFGDPVGDIKAFGAGSWVGTATSALDMAGYSVSGQTSVVVAVGNGATGLTSAHYGKIITNQGVTARADVTLPAAVAGICITFLAVDADKMKVIANTGDKIQRLNTLGAAGGYICSNASVSGANIMTLCAIDATEWWPAGNVDAGGFWTQDAGCA